MCCQIYFPLKTTFMSDLSPLGNYNVDSFCITVNTTAHGIGLLCFQISLWVVQTWQAWSPLRLFSSFLLQEAANSSNVYVLTVIVFVSCIWLHLRNILNPATKICQNFQSIFSIPYFCESLTKDANLFTTLTCGCQETLNCNASIYLPKYLSIV